jgi:hypothetical protein
MRNVKVKVPNGLTVMSEGALASEFEAMFWLVYPKREAKKAALKAYAKARVEATAEQIVEAVHQYIAHKPSWQNYALPGSWLNAGRYFDEYDAPTKARAPQPVEDILASLGHWTAGCKRMHGGTCQSSTEHYAKVDAHAESA